MSMLVDISKSYQKLRKYYFPIPDFPLNVLPSVHQSMNDLHTHENFSELVFVFNGYGTHWIGGRKYRIKAGDVFIVKGNVPHCYCDGHDLSLINLLFNLEDLLVLKYDLGEDSFFHDMFVIDPVSTAPSRFDMRFRLPPDCFNELHQKICELEELLNNTPRPTGVRFMAITRFMDIIVRLMEMNRKAETPEISERPFGKLAELAATLEQNYAKQITVKEMCRKTSMSYATLFRHFRRFYHDSPVNYLIKQRLSHAAELLRIQPDISIGEVAFQCGFMDTAYFSRKFKEKYAISPIRFRQNHAEEN